MLEINGIQFNGQSKVSDWYAVAYPDDKWGNQMMNKGIIFQDVFECLQVGFNIYALLGAGDSIVRERVFAALATLMGCDYEHIYYQWLNHEKKPLRGKLWSDMSKLRFKNEEDEKDKKIAELERQVRDAGWRYEYDHADDWRKPTEMGQV
jgi:hypothetical protein